MESTVPLLCSARGGYPGRSSPFSRYSTPFSLSNLKNSLKASGSVMSIVDAAEKFNVLQSLDRCAAMPIRPVVRLIGQRGHGQHSSIDTKYR